MVSNNKRIKYEYENEASTSEEESCDDADYMPDNKLGHQQKSKSKNFIELLNSPSELKKRTARSGRKPKCFSKNALLARENRIKKKVYITNLENNVSSLKSENKKLAEIVDNQSFLITDLRKQLKYLKSVIANSSDISKLIRNIHQTTGMSVSSSLDKNLSFKNICVPKLNPPIARKTAHPWQETDRFPSYPTPESNYSSSPNYELRDELAEVLNDVDLEMAMAIPVDELLDGTIFKDEVLHHTVELDEHNYTTTLDDGESNTDDVGVCLHVSKHRLSLEFCSTCSENAAHSWSN